MYFRNKFNKEIQVLARHQEKGASVVLGKFNSDLFYKQAPLPLSDTNTPPYVKIIPLIMYNRIKSSNKNDKVFDNSCVICENNPSTEITAYWEG